MADHYSWKFPQVAFLRIEMVFILILSLVIFSVSLYQFDYQWIVALATTLIFIGMYLLIAHGAKAVHTVEDVYHLTKTHLEVHRTRRHKVTHDKIALGNIHHHKLDHFFLGGYLVTKQGKKHLLYFNTKKEMGRFEKLVGKYVKFGKK